MELIRINYKDGNITRFNQYPLEEKELSCGVFDHFEELFSLFKNRGIVLVRNNIHFSVSISMDSLWVYAYLTANFRDSVGVQHQYKIQIDSAPKHKVTFLGDIPHRKHECVINGYTYSI